MKTQKQTLVMIACVGALCGWLPSKTGWAHGGGGGGGIHGGGFGNFSHASGGAAWGQGASEPRAISKVDSTVSSNPWTAWHGGAAWYNSGHPSSFHHGRVDRNGVIVYDDGFYGDYYPYDDYGYPPYDDAYAAYPAASVPPPATSSGALAAGDVVVNVQRALRSSGFFHGTVDGVTNPDTRAAIRTFQSHVGMAPTGVIDARLLGALGLM